MFAKGTLVQQVMPAPVSGTVVGYDVDQETGKVQVRVDWLDENGVDTHSRHFDEAELVAVTVAAPATA